MKIIAIALLMSGMLSAWAGMDICQNIEATQEDYRTLDYPVYDHPLVLKNWRAISGDQPAYASGKIDDHNWKPVKVGEAVTGQGISSSNWCWYRVDFDLPEAWYGHSLRLDIGRISAYDEIFLNGVRCGSYGNPPPLLTHGCSGIYRQYLLKPEQLKKGHNLLAIRVFLGHKGGLYDGAYTLQPLPLKTVCVRLPLKIGGAHSLKTLLTEAVHLNRFQSDNELLAAPELLSLSSTIIDGKLNISIATLQGRVAAEETTAVQLRPGQWQPVLLRLRTPCEPGKYICTLRYSEGAALLLEKKLELTVIPQSEPLTFAIPVLPELTGTGELPAKVTPGPIGRFGPREGSPKYQLRDNTELTDSRSGMTYSIQTARKTGAPLLFLSNTRPVPEKSDKIGRFHRAAGHEFDGFKDAWIYGYVRPNHAGTPETMGVKNISWSGRTYRYDYSDRNYLEFTVRAVSPAWMAETNYSELRVFDEIGRHGIGLPQYLAYESSNGQIKVVKAETGIKGDAMSANWILAWFNGGKNWQEFDTPYLFVLQNRPQSVNTYGDAALFFNYRGAVGKVQGMPLYGVSLLRPDETAGWSVGLPDAVIRRCHFWSRVLAAPPSEVKRTAGVDYQRDRLTVRDEVSYADWKDAWNTIGLKIAPVSTLLPLASDSGNMKITVDRTVTDLRMATLQGPLTAAENTDQLVFAIDGLLHYLREVREVEPADSAESAKVKAAFNQLLDEGYRTDFVKHPWRHLADNGRFLPGSFRCKYTNLLLSRQWMLLALQRNFDQKIQEFSEKYLLYSGLPDPAMQADLKPEYRNIPAVTVLTNPVSGLQLAAGSMIKENFGIDSVYFSNLNIYMAWLYADTYQRYDWLKPHYGLLQNYFNAARNSHDWATLASWDTFSGIRVGNGLQESGGIYAGTLAMARIARQLNDLPTSDLAAYHAVMQLVSMQGILAASKYLKQYRPWPATHSRNDEIEYVQKIRPAYFAELNEFAGLSQSLIGIGNSASSPGGYIESPLPEVMRPYQEIWRVYTDDFYDPHYDVIIKTDRRLDDRLSLDAFVYQTRRSPAELKTIFQLRTNLKSNWWERLPDYRGYLDSMSKIKYRRLW